MRTLITARHVVGYEDGHDVETVMVNGHVVVRGGTVKGVEERRLAHDLQGAAERLWGRIRTADWAHRSVMRCPRPRFRPGQEGAG